LGPSAHLTEAPTKMTAANLLSSSPTNNINAQRTPGKGSNCDWLGRHEDKRVVLSPDFLDNLFVSN
jgi:hypothetical protein